MNENKTTNPKQFPALTADITAATNPITALSFRVAKTMPEAPHEYVVRTPENEAAYVALFNLIGEHGIPEKWGGRRYRYWYPGDGWKYWRMANGLRYSRVLNRARADTPQSGVNPYDPQNPDMPPLINDVIVDRKKFDAEAKAAKKVAKEIGFTGIIDISRPSKKKKRPPTPPQKCPECGTTKNLTVAVKNVPDGRFRLGGRVVCDNDSHAKCECGFTGKVADFF